MFLKHGNTLGFYLRVNWSWSDVEIFRILICTYGKSLRSVVILFVDDSRFTGGGERRRRSGAEKCVDETIARTTSLREIIYVLYTRVIIIYVIRIRPNRYWTEPADKYNNRQPIMIITPICSTYIRVLPAVGRVSYERRVVFLLCSALQNFPGRYDLQVNRAYNMRIHA